MFEKPTSKVIEAKTIFLYDLFSDYLLKIPAYQRPYSWERVQAEELWDDIIACRDNNDQHFIGPMYFKIITNDENDYLEVTDGQQRLTSVTLLMLAMKRQLGIFTDQSDTNSFKFLKTNLDKLTKKDDLPRLTLGSSDKDAFKKIQDSYSEIPHKVSVFQETFDKNQIFLKSAVLLHSNFMYFDEKLKAIDSQAREKFGITDDKSNNEESTLQNYKNEVLSNYASILSTLMYRFLIIRCFIVSSDSTKTFKLFETINDRGRQLDQVDKIKNYLFKNVYNMSKIDSNPKYKNDYTNIQNLWSDLQKSLDNDIEDYIRYYIIQRNYLGKYIVPKKLFTEIQEHFEGKLVDNSEYDSEQEIKVDKERILRLYEKTMDLVTELHTHRECYNLIIEPGRSTLIEDDIIQSNLKYAYPYKIIRALLLREIILYRTCDIKKLRKMVAVTTNAAILYVSIFGLRKLDTVERNIWKVFFERDRLFETPDTVGIDLKLAMNQTDKSFVWSKELLEDKIQFLSNDQVAYYIQCKLNDYINDHSKNADFYNPLINKRPSKSAFNKDHILPQNYDADFKLIIDDYFTETGIDRPSQKQFRNEYISRIGNIIPLKRDANIEKSNTSDPIGFYNSLSVQGILVQQLVADFDTWGPKEIISRSRKIAKQIVENEVLTLEVSKAKF